MISQKGDEIAHHIAMDRVKGFIMLAILVDTDTYFTNITLNFAQNFQAPNEPG